MRTEMIEQIAKTAVQTALEYLEKEKQKQQKAKRDWRLRNTKLLLRNYRSFKRHCEEDLRREIEYYSDPELLQELDTDEFAIGIILRSKKRTAALMKYVDRMLATYRIACEQSGKEEEIRRYKTIHMMYISEVKTSADEVAEGHNLDRRTVYKDINKACEALSALMFGVDGIQMGGL